MFRTRSHDESSHRREIPSRPIANPRRVARHFHILPTKAGVVNVKTRIPNHCHGAVIDLNGTTPSEGRSRITRKGSDIRPSLHRGVPIVVPITFVCCHMGEQ